MKPKIGTLNIERFRAFRHLRIESLGRITLITGRNNTGKSSILEALRILTSNASSYVIDSILRFREEDNREREGSIQSLDSEGLFPWSSLFNGFPKFSSKLEPIVITSSGGQRPIEMSVGAAWASEEQTKDGIRRLVLQQQDLFGDGDEGEALPALVITVDGNQRLLTLGSLRRVRNSISYGYNRIADEQNMPCVFVNAYGGEQTGTLGPLWDKIVLSDYENDMVDALRIIDSGISAVAMVGDERQRRTAKVRSANFPHSVPLRSFGDGMNRLFGIILSLINAKDGLLLIDEFENGIHHTIQADAWRAIFKLASRLDIQVVATSHSWDAIEAFQKAASETEEEGVLIRLSRKGDDIIPTLFRENELAVATRDRIEVR